MGYGPSWKGRDPAVLRRATGTRDMPSIKTVLAAAAAFLLALVAPVLAADLELLDIETKGGVRHFQVEVVRTDADRERGLMFRRDLAADRGMLFQFDKEDRIYMWMKNTYLPLDMVFFGKDGRVVSVARDTEPLSERIISSGEPATAVVELNAGTAAKLGIDKGDRLIFPVPK